MDLQPSGLREKFVSYDVNAQMCMYCLWRLEVFHHDEKKHRLEISVFLPRSQPTDRVKSGINTENSNP